MGRPSKPTASAVSFTETSQMKVKDLKLDVKNIRLAHMPDAKQSEIRDHLWKAYKLTRLSDDIKARGLQEPLILYPDDNVVAEGNCRLVCILHILDGGDDDLKARFESIPCKRIVKNTPHIDIDAFLAETHIAKKADWPEFNQAKLMHKLYEKRGLSYEEIARITRKTRAGVNSKIIAYEFTLKYKDELGEDWYKKFIYVLEFVKNKRLEEFRESENNMKRFMSWVMEKKFKTSKDVRHLDKILVNEKACQIFETKNYASAFGILLEIDPTLKNTSYKKMVDITKVLNNFRRSEIKEIRDDKNKRKILHDLQTAIKEIFEEVKQ
ncbi:MAG: hypothetical protein MPJ05_07325 [Nitrosopumilus sp.]|nr:hypothetical protein [Nitrosopumilus sp.]MDA7953605.1 hypothetical protein [Nitrosopumilus sp.]